MSDRDYFAVHSNVPSDIEGSCKLPLFGLHSKFSSNRCFSLQILSSLMVSVLSSDLSEILLLLFEYSVSQVEGRILCFFRGVPLLIFVLELLDSSSLLPSVYNSSPDIQASSS